MRIAITTLTTPAQPLGVGRYLCSLIDALQTVDRDNSYLIYTSADSYQLFDLHADNFCEVRLPFRHDPRWIMRPSYFLWQNTCFLGRLRSQSVDVLHLPNSLPMFSKAIPMVVTIPDLSEFKIQRKYRRLRQWYRKTIVPVTVRNARRVIAISESTKSDLVDILSVPEDKIDVTYLGVSGFIVRARQAHGEPQAQNKYVTGPFILYVGAMYRHKNLERLLSSFHHLRASSSVGHKLVVAGKPGGQYQELLEVVERLGLRDEVVFTGYVPDEDLVCLYQQADLLAYVPLNEGFGLPVLEAMACGTPVITSNTSSLPEVAGDAALLVDPYDVESISSAMLWVLTDREQREELIVKGRENVKRFSWEECARLTVESYRKAMLGND